MNEKWFALTIEEIEKKLRTNAATGLSPKAARSRCNPKEPPFFKIKRRRCDKLFIDLLRDFFLVMLVLVAFFSLFFEGDYVIGSAMLILIVINLGMSFWIYFRERRTTESMADFFLPTARVIRGGKLYIADYRDVVLGDVILVEKGDVLGCDARLVYSNGLCVKMNIDQNTEKELQKLANGSPEENTVYVDKMANMLHAGSTVTSGSGRAIVVAVGQYTYLGAMMGGFTDVPTQKLPEGLAKLKKNFSRLGTILLALTLPFCIFSILFGYFTGGTVLLSEVLSVALAFGAGLMLSRFLDVFVGFFSCFIKRSALSEDPCIIRSPYIFDRLANTDCLFILDGSITTDGILHFDSLVTADGEANGFERMGQTATVLTDMLALYNNARQSTLSKGAESNGMFDIGFDEFMKRSKLDMTALNIRCKMISFLPMAQGGRDTLIYTDKGEWIEAVFSYSGDIIGECTHAMFAGTQKLLTDEGRDTIAKTLENLRAQGKEFVAVTVKNQTGFCLVGMFVLREGVDVTAERAVDRLKKSGVKVIMFTNCIGRTGVPEIPQSLRGGKHAHCGVFLKQGKDITYGFGEFDEYTYVDESMIAKLARYVKSKGKTLAVLGFSDYAKEAVEYADVFISCAPVRTGVFGHFAEEIRSLEIPGEQGSASCTQSIKAKADVLLMRPKERHGGLEPLARMSEYCKMSYRNLKNFLVYLLCVQTMRLVTVAFPMLWGNSTADARQLLFLSFILDFLTMLIFMGDTRRSTKRLDELRAELEGFGIAKAWKQTPKLFVSALVGGVSTLLLPNLMSLVPIFDAYIYKAEFTYTALLLLQIIALFCIYSGDLRNMAAHKRLITTPIALVQGAVIVVFTLLCFLVMPVGNLFGIVKNPIGYMLVSFVPALAFGICHLLMSVGGKEKKTKNKGKM